MNKDKLIENIVIFILAMSVLAGLFSCQKAEGQISPPQCAKCTLISYKYNADMLLFRTDILWEDNNVCGDELRKVRSVKQVDTLSWWNCPPPDNFPTMRMEIRKYFIN